MSGEQLTAEKSNETANINSSTKSKISKVNINYLLGKVRAEKNKERRESHMFLGLICAVIAITGIIASF